MQIFISSAKNAECYGYSFSNMKILFNHIIHNSSELCVCLLSKDLAGIHSLQALRASVKMSYLSYLSGNISRVKPSEE